MPRNLPLFAACFCLLLFSGAAAQPVERERSFREIDLVELVRLDSTIRLDIHYATANNFMKRRMYTQARAFLQRPAAEALVRVHAKLREEGYGVLIFDAYRPWSVTKKFWEATPPQKRKYVANPKNGSKHNRGCAVDLSLFRLATGREIEMPSAYDDFTEKASTHYNGGTPTQRQSRDRLRTAMESEGFMVNPEEWWHYDYRDWRVYPILDIPFEKLHSSYRFNLNKTMEGQ